MDRTPSASQHFSHLGPKIMHLLRTGSLSLLLHAMSQTCICKEPCKMKCPKVHQEKLIFYYSRALNWHSSWVILTVGHWKDEWMAYLTSHLFPKHRERRGKRLQLDSCTHPALQWPRPFPLLVLLLNFFSNLRMHQMMCHFPQSTSLLKCVKYEGFSRLFF